MSKKKGTVEKKLTLGRPGNNVKIGIVGLPNIGKSTLFNCLSGLEVPAENYAFCTKDPHVARVPVPDDRFDFLVKVFKPKSRVPAVLTVTDIAGLVKGANEGHGLGNSFLSNIQAVDAIFHVVRAFRAKNIEHVEGAIDPTRDLEIISKELALKDIAWLKTKRTSVERRAKSPQDKVARAEFDLCNKAIELLEGGEDIRNGDWNLAEIAILNELQLLTAKPVVYLVNVTEKAFRQKKSKWFKPIHDWVNERTPGALIIPFSAALEKQLAKDGESKESKSEDNGDTQSILPKIIRTGYKTLGLVNFFTAGGDEVRAWTLKKDSLCPKAGAVIHSDFEKGFQSADIYTFDDFKEHGSEQALRKAGKIRSQGKHYVVQDGDVIHFKTNARKAKK